MQEALLGGVFSLAAAILGALVAVMLQNRQIQKQNAELRLEQVASSKRAVIEDLVAYRFVLTEGSVNEVASAKFNAALSKVPIAFASNAKCIQLYREFGEKFTSEKFCDLVFTLMQDVPLETRHVDRDILENVPAKR